MCGCAFVFVTFCLLKRYLKESNFGLCQVGIMDCCVPILKLQLANVFSGRQRSLEVIKGEEVTTQKGKRVSTYRTGNVDNSY